jgi:hypothetical protein
MGEMDTENANSKGSEWKTAEDDESGSFITIITLSYLSVSTNTTPRGAHGGMLMKGGFLGVGGVAAMLSGSLVGDACHREVAAEPNDTSRSGKRHLQIQLNRKGSSSASTKL